MCRLEFDSLNLKEGVWFDLSICPLLDQPWWTGGWASQARVARFGSHAHFEVRKQKRPIWRDEARPCLWRHGPPVPSPGMPNQPLLWKTVENYLHPSRTKPWLWWEYSKAHAWGSQSYFWGRLFCSLLTDYLKEENFNQMHKIWYFCCKLCLFSVKRKIWVYLAVLSEFQFSHL